jgi:ABC-2 type transport system ATP-binding protein
MVRSGQDPNAVAAQAIRISGLTKTYNRRKVVDDLSFTAEPGTVVGFLGPNGAGKSTTLRMLLGLVAPDSGKATIGGHRYSDLATPNDTVGALLDATAFHQRRSGLSHLRIYCTVNGYPRHRANEVLALVGLADAGSQTVDGYSLGMRQRLALATALLGDPPVLVLDEPANGLDPEGIVWMRHLLRDYADRGHTVLVSSHVLMEVQLLADRVVIIDRGRLVREGALDELADRGHTAVSVRTPQAAALEAALSPLISDSVRVEHTGRERLRVTGLSSTEVGRRAFVAGIELHELIPQHSDLERAFFELTGHADPAPDH